jgi:hypothetical protein
LASSEVPDTVPAGAENEALVDSAVFACNEDPYIRHAALGEYGRAEYWTMNIVCAFLTTH